jgi:hypothetical protein
LFKHWTHIINCRMSVVVKKNKICCRKVRILLLLPQRMFFANYPRFLAK